MLRDRYCQFTSIVLILTVPCRNRSLAVLDGNLIYKGESSPVKDEFRVEFVKGGSDNPKICAVALVKGSAAGA